jgi:succinoglycan biosynthesis transport protein ExoP
MDPKLQQQIKQYLNILLRWKKLILGCVLVSLIAGLGLYVKIPKTYRAEALLVYQPGRINPTNKLAPSMAGEVRDVLATLKDQVLSRSSLEEIVKQLDLFQSSPATQSMEDVIERMRSSSIEIKYSRGDTFTVAFKGPEPRMVMLAANALAAKFVEENLRFREEKATETSAYIKDELAIIQKSLEEKEAAMRDYKLQYYNELPDQRQTNISRLNALQTTYQDIQNSLQELERTKVMVQEQIGTRKNLLSHSLEELDPQQNSEAGGYRRLANQLNAARTELAGLEARYTEQHPEVKRLKKIISQLEDSLRNAVSTSDSEQQTKEGNRGKGFQQSDSQLKKLELQLKDIELSMAQLKNEKEAAKQQMGTYQEWISAAPIREAEWAGLTRDYEQLRRRYQELVASNLTAESAETLERKQKGSQFKVVDPARLPEKPFKPDLKKILLMSLLLGLGLGSAITFCIEFSDSSFKEAHDLEDYLNLPIVCSIPVIHTEPEKKRIFFRNILWSLCFLAVFLSLLAGSVYLWQKGILII